MQKSIERKSEDFFSFMVHTSAMNSLSIESELGILKRVIIHTPGPEIEAMTPGDAEKDLYNDIIPLDSVLVRVSFS